MRTLNASLIAAFGVLAILAPSQSEAQVKQYCGLKEGYITQVNHGDIYEKDYPILVIIYRDVDGAEQRVSTKGLQDMRTAAEARSLESMAVSAMLSKALVRFMFNQCLHSSRDGNTWLWGMEMKGG
ncbi:hypothetical protein [Caulobacter sp. RHG1]|uniref:hypothetical protein n=1 Tax=Caulobacter sp. (strain RHG1) TaxID=2545762 RepID=UPI0015574C76|nr:hypothetical protein [Caulobacter sp. RHG1]